eukprot:1173788-Rhodomonas_salina.3
MQPPSSSLAELKLEHHAPAQNRTRRREHAISVPRKTEQRQKRREGGGGPDEIGDRDGDVEAAQEGEDVPHLKEQRPAHPWQPQPLGQLRPSHTRSEGSWGGRECYLSCPTLVALPRAALGTCTAE